MQKMFSLFVWLGFISLWGGIAAFAQQPDAPSVSSAASGVTAPRLIKFSGVLKDSAGQPLTGVTGVTLSLYSVQEGGTALWMETQNVSLDAQGNYTVLLGAATSQGMPVDLFTSGESRWLGVQAQTAGSVEPPRVLLVTVPYALKAADADTVGGKPASAFLLAPTADQSGSDSTQSAASVISGQRIIDRIASASVTTNGGTANFLSMWDASADLTNSVVFQSAGGLVGIGTSSPSQKLDVSGNISIPAGSAYMFDGATLAFANAAHNNAFFGYAAGNLSATGTYNVGVGYVALNALTTGTYNTAVGPNALQLNTTGSGNTAFGVTSLQVTTTGNNNSAFGGQSMLFNTSGSQNLAIGFDSLYSDTTGYYNTGIGNASLFDLNITANDGSGNNTAIGYNTGRGITTGVNNTIIGANVGGLAAGLSNRIILADGTGAQRIYVNNLGQVGLGTTTPGAGLDVQNGAINAPGGLCLDTCKTAWPTGGGSGTVTSVTPGDGSIAIGGTAANPTVAVAALGITSAKIASATIVDSNISASAAIAPSKISGTAATLGTNSFTATQTISSGNLALDNTNISGTAGVITLGTQPFLHNFGDNNTFLGLGAGNLKVTLNGGGNVGIGYQALNVLTNGAFNTAIGADALAGNQSGAFNTAIGGQALFLNSPDNNGGGNNTAIGFQALRNNTVGNINTAIGVTALTGNIYGNNNTATGFGALTQNTGSSDGTMGNNNTADGWNALGANTTGNNNIALGYGAGFDTNGGNRSTTGSNNIFIGFNSGLWSNGAGTQYSNATAIGANAVVSANNALVLGGIAGTNGGTSVKVGIGIAAPAYALDVEGSSAQINASGGFCINGTSCVTSWPTGTVTAVTAGDSSIMIGGTAVDPTVAVAIAGVTSAKIAASTIVDSNISDTASINPGKINGTAATLLGSNTFFATQTILGSLGIGNSPSDNLDVNLGLSSPADKGITIEGSTVSAGDLGLKINNQGTGGVNWYLDSTNNNSGYGGGRLAFVPGPRGTPLMTLSSFNSLNGYPGVGIGTTNPTALLHLVGSQPPAATSSNGVYAEGVLQITGGKGGNTGDGVSAGGLGGGINITAGNGGDNTSGNIFGGGGQGGSITLQPGVGGLGFASGGSGNIILAPTGGKVGIGTTNPTALLHVVGSQPPAETSGAGVNGATVLQIVGGAGGNTSDGSAAGGVGGGINITAGDGGDNTAVGGGQRGSGGSITLQPGLGSFGSSNGSVILAPNGGSVGIGTQTTRLGLDVFGNINASGCFSVGGTPFQGNCSSDARLKKNIQYFPQVLDKLVQLQPASWNWRTEEFPEYHFGSSRATGLVAQEVEKVFPEMVSTDARGYKQVNYTELPYLMLQAIRELKTENDTLRERVDQLKEEQTEIRQLRADVERLKASENVQAATLTTSIR